MMPGRLNWVDEVERDERMGRAFSFSRSSSRLPPPPPPPLPISEDVVAETAIADSAQLESLCFTEFGFSLRELKDRFSLLSQELQSGLNAFCTDISRIHDAARQRELAISFMEGIAQVTKLATDRSTRTLVKMQSTYLERLQRENDLLRNRISLSEVQATNLRCAWEQSEAEKDSMEAIAGERFEEEKAILEVSMREGLRACKICERNPRNVIIMPCFHGQYCAECLEGHQRSSNRCPSCRGIIRGTMPYIA